jgi:pilus assembly protein Flp/PilA
MRKIVSAFINDESGAAAAEYALILAILGAGIVAATGVLGGAISGAMVRAGGAMDAVLPAPTAP